MDELNAAAAGDEELGARAAGVALTVQQVVTPSPAGGGAASAACSWQGATYAIRVAGGRVEVVAGGVDDPDVTLSEDYATAAALSRGELSAEAALLAGRIRVRGDSGALARGQDVLHRVQACFDQVRSRTSY
ncbi:MAG: SCP2 sterol-binding domain-containing protein [Acidimicrobiales bacterium]